MAAAARFGLKTVDGKRPRVAVVDGNRASAMVAVALIEQFGCETITASSGEAILALIRAGETIDLVMLDLGIPDMDGVVAVQLIRTLGQPGAMPILALANGPNAAANARARAAGLSGTLRKPYSPRELYGAMAMALERQPAPALSREH